MKVVLFYVTSRIGGFEPVLNGVDWLGEVGENDRMSVLKHVILVPACALVIGGFTLTALAGPSSAQTVKQRVLQQQEQLRKKKMLEEQQMQQQQANPDTSTETRSIPDDKAANQGRHNEANAIYRNLRIEQKLSHQAAIAALKNSGFPTDQIVEIP